MPGAARLGDKAQTSADAHGCPACPHPAIGPIVTGSPDVFIDGKPAARMDDLGIHSACCGSNTFTIARGSSTVYVNGKPLARAQDKTRHCGGTGPIVEASTDVLIDDGAAAAAGLMARAWSASAAGLPGAAPAAGTRPGASPVSTPAAAPPASPVAPAPAAAPTLQCVKAVPPEAPGGCDYYQRRQDSFLRRHRGCGHHPPDYYLGYGKKYCLLFTTSLNPRLSPAGQAWLARAKINLQVAIEKGLVRTPELELDNDGFREFVFATHADAYWSAGLHDLSIADKALIAWTPDLREWLKGETWRQAADVAARDADATAADVERAAERELIRMYFGGIY